VRQRAWLEQRARSLSAQTGADHHGLFSHTVVVLHRRWHDLVPPREHTGRAFARQVMANGLRDLARTGHARYEQPSEDVRALLEQRLPPNQWADDPEFEVLRKERRLRIHRAIRELPEPERWVMALRTEEHSLPAVAELLEMELADVRNAMLRARRALRARLEEGADDDR
jgi:RNA polymerase sigma factor (sigma-70 family)